GFAPSFTDVLTYPVRFPHPLTLSGTFYFELAHSPENSIRHNDGLLELLMQTNPGDTVLVEQLYERLSWSDSRNLRLQAYVDAARAGARVRILLDDCYDRDENAQVVRYLNDLAQKEKLDLEAQLANPMGAGLHNKMVLAHIGGRGYVWAGSINGSEVAFKANREVGFLVQSDEAYEYLAAMFQRDWEAPYGRYFTYLPLTLKGFKMPDYLLISEVFYDAPGDDEGREWVEIYNPTGKTTDVSDYKIGDAQESGLYEGMYRFPEGAVIGSGEVIVVAETASGFYELYGHKPDFELSDTDPQIPDMMPYIKWGKGSWRLKNAGDEILLLGPDDSPVDVVVYGEGVYPGVNPYQGALREGESLERYPPIRDTDDCAADFRVARLPSPGCLPGDSKPSGRCSH
ncbi:MAG TPA: hypothetical protein ENG33_00925, partial [Chloroflexi bacterium]|nr:hypothetical protein [Chloroflexota bacterium]